MIEKITSFLGRNFELSLNCPVLSNEISPDFVVYVNYTTYL